VNVATQEAVRSAITPPDGASTIRCSGSIAFAKLQRAQMFHFDTAAIVGFLHTAK
jgi:hypothetical protein